MAKPPQKFNMRKAALAYAGRGWPVFPLRAGGKTPLTRHGLHDASTLAAQIGAWWVKWPNANIGVDCGRAGLVAIDVDPDKGGLTTWSALDEGVVTLTSHTGGGGYHFLYAQPRGRKAVRSNAGRLGPGVDVRGTGGYIVLPPSLHESGRRYQWIRNRGGQDELYMVAALPLNLQALLQRPCRTPVRRPAPLRTKEQEGNNEAYVQAALRGEVERVRLAREGTRNCSLNRAAFALGQLAGAGTLEERRVEAELVGAALTAGLDEAEARRTFASGFYAGLRKPRSIPPRTPHAVPDTRVQWGLGENIRRFRPHANFDTYVVIY